MAENLLAKVSITTKGKRHLVAVIGSTGYCKEYVRDLIKDWDNESTILSTNAETQPQAAYSGFSSEFKNKLNYFLGIISNIHHLLLPLERKIRNKFIPALAGDHICNDKE